MLGLETLLRQLRTKVRSPAQLRQDLRAGLLAGPACIGIAEMAYVPYFRCLQPLLTHQSLLRLPHPLHFFQHLPLHLSVPSIYPSVCLPVHLHLSFIYPSIYSPTTLSNTLSTSTSHIHLMHKSSDCLEGSLKCSVKSISNARTRCQQHRKTYDDNTNATL